MARSKEKDAAFLLVEALSRQGGAFDGLDTAEIMSQLDQLQRGWPIQHEFQLLSLWSERCVLIHSLDADGQHPVSSDDRFCVPDFLAIYEAEDGREISVLVEVKSTEGDPFTKQGTKYSPSRSGSLKFGKKYMDGLRAYSSAVGLPLIVAWKLKFLGQWLLFSIDAVPQRKSAFLIDFPTAMTHDLSGVLLGNFWATVRADSSMTLRFVDVVGDETHFRGTCNEIALVGPAGYETSLLRPLEAIFRRVPNHSVARKSGERLDLSFVVEGDTSVSCFQLFVLAVTNASGEFDVNWYRVRQESAFRWTIKDAVAAIEQAGAVGVISHVIHQVPEIMPDFLALTSGKEPP